MQPSSDIIERVRKLLRKGNDKGTSPAESQAFLEKAMALMQEHNISNMLIESKEAEDAKPAWNIVKEYFYTKRQTYETDQYMAEILRSCFFVRVLWSHDFERVDTARKGEVFCSIKKRLVYVLVGDKTDVEMAKMIIQELHPMMRHLLQRHLRAGGLTWNAETCHSYFSGFASGYIKMNKAVKEQSALDAGGDAANRYAIVVASKEEATKEFYSKIQTVRARGFGGPRSGGGDDQAYGKGLEKGKSVKLGTKKLS